MCAKGVSQLIPVTLPALGSIILNHAHEMCCEKANVCCGV